MAFEGQGGAIEGGGLGRRVECMYRLYHRRLAVFLPRTFDKKKVFFSFSSFFLRRVDCCVTT